MSAGADRAKRLRGHEIRKKRVNEGQTLPRENLDVDVLTMAYERTAHCFSLYDEVSVGFSGGKDSTVLLNIAVDVAERLDRLPLRVIHMDEEAIPVQTGEYVQRTIDHFGDRIALEWYCMPFRNNNACSRDSPYWWPWAPESRDLWVRDLPGPAITHLDGWPEDPMARPPHYQASWLLHPPERGRQIHLMGIRAQESMNRLRAVSHVAEENYIVMSGWPDGKQIHKGYPIYDWRTEDVWTAPARLGWDYNRAYDIMAMAGLTLTQQRCSPAYGNEPMQKLWIFAECFPEVWEKMIDRVPGAHTAAMYAATELYGFGSVPDKPDGIGWGDWIRSFIIKHEPKFRGQTAERVQFWIRNHYNKTTDPILPDTPHPDSGVSLDWLVRLAMRGDRMERQQAGHRATSMTRDPAAYDRHVARYRAELATYEGRMSDLDL